MGNALKAAEIESMMLLGSSKGEDPRSNRRE